MHIHKVKRVLTARLQVGGVFLTEELPECLGLYPLLILSWRHERRGSEVAVAQLLSHVIDILLSVILHRLTDVIGHP